MLISCLKMEYEIFLKQIREFSVGLGSSFAIHVTDCVLTTEVVFVGCVLFSKDAFFLRQDCLKITYSPTC